MNKPLKTYKNTFPIGTKQVECTVRIYAEPEQENFDSLTKYMDHGLRKETRQRMERGELDCMYVVVEVEACGVTGSDSIGCVFVSKPEHVDQCIVDHNMEHNAHEDLKAKMLSLYVDLKAVLNE